MAIERVIEGNTQDLIGNTDNDPTSTGVTNWETTPRIGTAKILSFFEHWVLAFTLKCT